MITSMLMKKSKWKKRTTKGKKRHDKINNNEKEQLRKFKKEAKTVRHDNPNANEKEQMKKDGNKRKKEKHVNLGENEKEQLRK